MYLFFCYFWVLKIIINYKSQIMKKNLILVLLFAGLIIPLKQVNAQSSSRFQALKHLEILCEKNNSKSIKMKKDKTYSSKTTKHKQKAGNMDYQLVTSLPYTNSSTLDEDSYFLDIPYFSYGEGYEIILTESQSIKILQESDDVDCYLYLLDSNFNIIAANDDYNEDDFNSQIVFSAFYTGTYYIIAGGYDEEEIGDYTIAIDYYLQSLSAQAYYVDALNGNNANAGQDPTDAKQTIQSVLEITNNGIVYIMSDILLDTTIVIENTSVICLAPYNGENYTIKRSAKCENSHMIELIGSMLYLLNDTIAGSLIFDGGYSDTATSPLITEGAILYVDVESIVFMYPFNMLQNNFTDAAAPAIYNEGMFYMYGGTISNNVGSFSSAITNIGNFLMFDGNISDNIASSCSGVLTENLFVMFNGSINNNTATDDHSGITNYLLFYMYGGTINNNIADMAAGVINYYYAMISGGAIADNEAESMSSGVINEEGGELILSGGTIYGNVASYYPNQGIIHIGISCSLSDNVTFGNDNQIFLLEGKTIKVNGSLTHRTVGTIMPFKFDNNDIPDYAHRTGLQVLSGTNNGIRTDYTKFKVADDGDGDQWSIDSLGKLVGDDVSIINYFDNYSINIYPSPATNNLYIHLEDISSGKIIVKLYDISGKLVCQVEMNDNYDVINIEHLSKGIYFLQLSKDNQIIDHRKIIKH